MDRHPYSLGGLREDAVGDCSERQESITSGRHLGVHQPDNIRNVAGHPGCSPPCSNTTSVSTVLGFLDGTSTKEDLLRALSIIRAERAQVSSDDGSLLASSDTFLDLCARSSSPASKRQLESPGYGYLQVPHSQHGVSPRSQLTDLPSPAATYATSVEDIQDFLPDFLDLYSDGDPPGSVANEMLSSGSGSLRLLVQDERLAPVPEGSATYPSQERKPMAVENDQPDPELANLLPGTHFGAQTQRSAAELVSGYSRPAHPFVSSQSYSQSRSAHGDFQHINSYGRRGNHQASPVSATVTVTAEETGGSYPHRVYDNGKGPLAEYAELAYRQSVVESDGPRSDGSYYAKRVQDDRAGVSRHGKLGLPMAVRSSSPGDFQPREVGRVVQRPRAMTVQEGSVSGLATSDRLHRSASATSSTSTSSPSRRRYRTLSDRAYRHPDVPHSPLFSDLDHPPLPQGGYYRGLSAAIT
ncbi:hypothetical protein BC826DRAFT_108628 [Russula brevipes]|nr:hypothetical protein BC826DRAFT_108628 [Russula brevipes]